MPAQMLAAVKGGITMLLLALNVIAWCTPLFLLALTKLLIPWQPWRNRVTAWLNALGENWISCNGALLWRARSVRLDVRGVAGLRRRDWYLMIVNHRSWVDILVVQQAFNRKVPFLKFFIKERLKWVPFLGLAWWALDMPFMKRYSSAWLARHPEMRGRDLEATRRACEKFRRLPTTIINFVEGTRFTPAKHAAAGGGYRHLLPPKSGGVAYALTAMSGMLRSTLDVTIAYGARTPSLWDLCCGRLERLIVQVREREIEPWMQVGDYAGDAAFRARFQEMIVGYWRDKDELLDGLLAELR
jgi:1-acyl-sn-glycerol-3-phosphate acyltransferase